MSTETNTPGGHAPGKAPVPYAPAGAAVQAAVTPIPTSLNVTALAKRFGVARTTIQRRLRKGWVPPTKMQHKPRKTAADATPQAAPGAAPDVPPLAHMAATVTVATLVAALALATCSAAFSISGLTAIFAGAWWPVVGMGAALEVGKLSAVAWLAPAEASGQRRGARPLRAALVALVAVLMVLNSIGVYGFLSRAHIEHALAGDLTVASRAADVDARLTVQAGVVADLDRQIGQVDAAVEKTADRGRGKAAMTLAEEQRKNRADLVASRTKEAGTLASLKVRKAAIDGERKAVEADTGPVRYLAILIGSTNEQAMRWFILMVALLLDPAAVLLLLAATPAPQPAHRGHQ
jgi:hypothetical protein